MTEVEDIVIYGSGGMAREVVELIEDINSTNPSWQIKGYLDDIKGNCGELINGYRVFGTSDSLKKLDRPINVILAVSDPIKKIKMYNKIKDCNVISPVLIHPSAKVSKSTKIGKGSIIGVDCIVSVNANIGNHVFLNMRTVVGHDSKIDDFCSCLVNCIIAGDVTLGEGVLMGSGSIVMEKKTIGKYAKTGMGSIISFDVQANHIVMSRPSKSMYFGN